MKPELTNDECACLMIMAEGGSLAAIGRWEKSCDSLVAQGFAQRHDKFNHSITEPGRAALAAREQSDEGARNALQPAAEQAHTQARGHVEAAAQHLARAARVSAPVTGDDVSTALLRWNRACLDRAKELLRD